jgi:recombination protein RecA
MRRSQTIKDGDKLIGSTAKVKIVKNKVAAPFRNCQFDIMYGTGISQPGCIIDLGEETGIVDRAGSWYSYGDVRLGQGRENSKEFLRDNPEVMEEIDEKIRVKVGLIDGEEENAEEGKEKEEE